MGLFERYLTVWVGLGMAAGAGLGLAGPGLIQAVAALEWAQVNLVVAVFISVMIYPLMIQIDLASIKDVGQRPRRLLLTRVVNWLIKPFTMAALAVRFFEHLFAPWVDFASAREYIAGMILLGVVPCTAMAFVWSQLVKNIAAYTLVQVSVNDLVMVFAFAPIAAFLLGVTDVTVPWQTLALQSCGIFAISYVAAHRLKLPFDIAAPACMIGTSNFFELALAVAVTISLFGLHSGAAPATVVGVRVEVPVMLSLVAFANRTRH